MSESTKTNCQSKDCSPQPRVYPPVYFIGGLGLIFFFDSIWPGPFFALSEALEFTAWFGLSLSLAGIVIFFHSASLFLKNETRLTPFEESTYLIKEGAYRFSRNPIYLGMILVLAGVEIALGMGLGFFVCLAFFFIIRNRFVLPEEVHMEEAFGENYLEFKKTTRRWL